MKNAKLTSAIVVVMGVAGILLLWWLTGIGIMAERLFVVLSGVVASVVAPTILALFKGDRRERWKHAVGLVTEAIGDNMAIDFTHAGKADVIPKVARLGNKIDVLCEMKQMDRLCVYYEVYREFVETSIDDRRRLCMMVCEMRGWLVEMEREIGDYECMMHEAN